MNPAGERPAQVIGLTRPAPANEAELDELLTRPTERTLSAVRDLEGDLLILGAGGKMGPSLAGLARRSLDAAGLRHRVICISRFSSRHTRAQLEATGIETIACDLLDREALAALPNAPNVVFMAGFKFGASTSPALAWALNAYLPGLVGERYRDARIVVLSTGNVYPLVPIDSSGATEEMPTAPLGEYAQSCLGRERIFEFVSTRYEAPVTLIRLNYATDLRYGVLHDIAARVAERRPISLDAGYVNTIWQGDANAVVLQAFALCSSPPSVLNVTGPETVGVREVAHRFAVLLSTPPPSFDGVEPETALLSNASRCHALFELPTVTLEDLIEWTAEWVRSGGRNLGQPTHFEVRDGGF